MRQQHPLGLDPGHPLFPIAAMRHEPATGAVEIRFTDGRSEHGAIAPLDAPTWIREMTFDVRTSNLQATLHGGAELTMSIGTVRTPVDRPVVYLDQNHWIDMARFSIGSTTLSDERRRTCRRITELAMHEQILLPISSAHLVEIAKKADRQRTEVAQVMMKLSKGWQMRSPLYVQRSELERMFGGAPECLGKGEVFTLEPGALFSDAPRPGTEPSPAAVDDLPADLQGLVQRLSWTAAIVDTFVDTERLMSDDGLRKARQWATSFHDLALHVRGNPKARRQLRQITGVRFLSDIQTDLAGVALAAGLTTEEFRDWCQDQAENDIAAAPMLGRFRELLHLRVSNADDKWAANDLNDTLYLCCAGAYADIVVGERKMTSYLQRASSKVTKGATLFRHLEDALPAIEYATG
ncbi:hypothetical protein ACFQS1_37015 [Paractinoplanes rhizophilus]|uniref:Uncharacterized protein n=1 Tax=Paractinoplanes rhizophilus TaxID=1416877 RepID=A0ABW2I3Z5_9ACTN